MKINQCDNKGKKVTEENEHKRVTFVTFFNLLIFCSLKQDNSHIV